MVGMRILDCRSIVKWTFPASEPIGQLRRVLIHNGSLVADTLTPFVQVPLSSGGLSSVCNSHRQNRRDACITTISDLLGILD